MTDRVTMLQQKQQELLQKIAFLEQAEAEAAAGAPSAAARCAGGSEERHQTGERDGPPSYGGMRAAPVAAGVARGAPPRAGAAAAQCNPAAQALPPIPSQAQRQSQSQSRSRSRSRPSRRSRRFSRC